MTFHAFSGAKYGIFGSKIELVFSFLVENSHFLVENPEKINYPMNQAITPCKIHKSSPRHILHSLLPNHH